MKKFTSLLALVLALSLLGGCASLKTPLQTLQSTTSATRNDLTPAPDFTVYDAGGNPVKLSDHLGKPVVLNFWASWCGPCRKEMPDFDEVYKEMGDQVAFLIINLTDGKQETVDSASAFIASQGYTFPVFYDTASQAAYAYGVQSIPTTYFVDAQGYLVARATGAIDKETLKRGIEMIKS